RCRRRTGGPFHRRSPHAVGRRYADRRPGSAHRRQLAQALSRVGPAQPSARQSSALHAVPAELAGLHSQGQAGRLVRGLCGEHGAQLSDGQRIRSGSYDETAKRWSVLVRRVDGTTRGMHPRHVVMATGVSGIPSLPDIPSLRNFRGEILHSSEYEDGEAWKGKTALVIGSGNSGHDIAQDLHSAGAKVTLVQRSSTMIVNVEPSAQLQYALYDEGPPLEDCDLITASMPLPWSAKVTSR